MVENPPAFPGGWPEAGYEPCYGMTLRDWFAGQALAGLSAHIVGAKRRSAETQSEADARAAYERADAMLAERSK